MIDFNPAWIYQLAEVLTKIEDIHTGTPLPHVSQDLAVAASELRNFLDHQQHTIFPDTCGAVRRVVECIDAIQPPSLPVAPRMLEFQELVDLESAINGAVIAFQMECEKKYIVGLERQRALEPQTLIEEIESAVSPECWKHLSHTTKREIEECGRCLAFERYTASGFHVLRGLENEVTDYICVLLHEKPKPAQRNFGHYIQILKDNGADLKLVAALDSIRSLDRNPLVHPEDWLNKDEAIGIFNTVQTALERLISDMEKKHLLPS